MSPPSQQDGRKLDNLVIPGAFFPRITSVLQDSMRSVPWYRWGRSGGSRWSSANCPHRFLLKGSWTPGSIGSRDSLLGLFPMRGKWSFFWGQLKACVPGVPTSHSLESGHFQLNTMKREPTSNLSLPLLPPSVWKKLLAWERLPTFCDCTEFSFSLWAP